MAITLFGAFFVVLFNALVDIAYAYLDPRIRLGSLGANERAEPLLSACRDLRVGFATEGGRVQAVDGVSFDLAPGEVLAIVGESGSGKSVTAQTIIGLTRSPNARIEGSVAARRSRSCSSAERRGELRKVRGERIGMVFQDPMTSFNPVYRIGDQIVEAIRAHRPETSEREARERAVELLDSVGIPNAAQRVDDYPHEFSGGMRQRAMIAMALALEPEVLIADEPTTALDVTVQAQILALLERLNRERGLATILITHDLGVVAEVADRVLVMYAGAIVERGGLDEIFYAPAPLHAQAARRRACGSTRRRRCGRRRESEPLLEVTDLVKHFPVKRGLLFDREVDRVRAVDGVSFSVRRGETLGLVGESGSGKSTLSRTILQLLKPTSGSVRFEGREIAGLSRRADAAAAARDADGLPGPLRLAQPAQAGRPDRRRPAAAAGRGQRRRAAPPGAGAARAGRPLAPSTTTASRTSSPAASGSGSGSPGRWRCGRS